jgi:hypothetical protein
MSIYMKYGSITGDTPTAGSHTGWIQIDSFQFGVSRSFSSPTGGSSDREGSSPSLSEIVVTKPSPYSLKTVTIINSSLGPPQPSAGRQTPPSRPRAKMPLPPWLKNILVELRPLMSPGGTIHLSGFDFNPRDLSTIAGVSVRDLP